MSRFSGFASHAPAAKMPSAGIPVAASPSTLALRENTWAMLTMSVRVARHEERGQRVDPEVRPPEITTRSASTSPPAWIVASSFTSSKKPRASAA